MTLSEVISNLEYAAAQEPAVNMIVENDVFRINSIPNVRYGVFAWVNGQHNASLDSSLMRYTFTLIYVDRLTSAQDNQVEIHSVGIQVLDSVIRNIADRGIIANDYNFTTFNQRFVDECAGVFCNVTFEVPITSVCGEGLVDFQALPIMVV